MEVSSEEFAELSDLKLQIEEPLESGIRSSICLLRIFEGFEECETLFAKALWQIVWVRPVSVDFGTFMRGPIQVLQIRGTSQQLAEL